MAQIYGDEYGLLPPVNAGGVTKPFSWPSHKGIDIGWGTRNDDPIMAWQDGTVVDKGYGYQVGYFIVLQHDYADGTKRYTGYIHLRSVPNVTLGQKFSLGEKMGNACMGNTGQSNWEHLHLYLTKKINNSIPYTWDTMLANSIDPYPHLCYSKKFNTGYISSEWKKELTEMIYPNPVKRNEYKHQCEIKSTTRRMRKVPDGDIWDQLCVPGIYNVKEIVNKGAYSWGLIDEISGNQFWVAIMSGEDLPAKVPVIYPEPVERNPAVEQCDIKSDTRRLRSSPSSADDKNIYEQLCKKGIYNVFQYEAVGDQDWALIGTDVNGHEFWVAVMAGEDLPITDYKEMYEKEAELRVELAARIKAIEDEKSELEVNLMKLEDEYDTIAKQLVTAQSKLRSIKNVLEG